MHNIQKRYLEVAKKHNKAVTKASFDAQAEIVKEKLNPVFSGDNKKMDDVIEKYLKLNKIDKHKEKYDLAVAELFTWGLAILYGSSKEAQQAFFASVYTTCKKDYKLETIPDSCTLKELFNMSNNIKQLENVLIQKIMEFSNGK